MSATVGQFAASPREGSELATRMRRATGGRLRESEVSTTPGTFEEACELVRSLGTNHGHSGFDVSLTEKVSLYVLYKLATEGPYRGPEEPLPTGGLLGSLASAMDPKAEYTRAWERAGDGLSKEEAREAYLNLVRTKVASRSRQRGGE